MTTHSKFDKLPTERRNFKNGVNRDWLEPPPGLPPPIPGIGIPDLPVLHLLPKTEWKKVTRLSKTYYYNESKNKVNLCV